MKKRLLIVGGGGAACGVLGLTVAMTGATEKIIKTFDPESELSNYEKI